MVRATLDHDSCRRSIGLVEIEYLALGEDVGGVATPASAGL
jgi:hypothetical protein